MDDKPIRKACFNAIEPFYAILAARSLKGLIKYHNQPKETFIEFMKACGFKVINQTGDKAPYIISEMIVFEKIDTETFQEYDDFI